MLAASSRHGLSLVLGISLAETEATLAAFDRHVAGGAMAFLGLAVAGGLLGCLLALPINGFSTASGQTPSFSEVAFAFQVTPDILESGIVFAMLMGLIGGLLPAVRAASCRTAP